MKDIKNKCSGCGEDVGESAKKCPGCGKKLKSGMAAKIFLTLIFVGAGYALVDEMLGAKEDKISELVAAEVSNLRPDGELAEMFWTGSENTRLQLDLKKKEIEGAVVQWTLPVNEIKQSGDDFRVDTAGTSMFHMGFSSRRLSATVMISPRNNAERAYVASLKEGDQIKFKGVLKRIDTVIGAEIEPAIVIMP